MQVLKRVDLKTDNTKTYKTKENVDKAVSKLPPKLLDTGKTIRYIICQTDEGRFFPVFIGAEAAQAGIHFHHHILG